MAYVKDLDVHDAVVRLSDLIESETDPAIRLLLAHRALQQAKRELSHLRDKSAWEARQRYGLVELERLAGVNHGSIAGWTEAHSARASVPLPTKRQHGRPMEFHDLSRLPADRQDSLARRGLAALPDSE